jgi:hypothetical protein
MTKTTPNQATSAGRPNPGLTTKTYLASRQLHVDGTLRLPGQLVPEAASWKGRVRDIHLDLGWLEEVRLVSDHDRDLADQQWQAEETARAEAAKQQEAEVQQRRQQPAVNERFIGHKDNLPPLTLRCANCKYSFGFDHPVDDDERWMCTSCGQWQTGEQSRRGTLQMINVPAGSHAVNHNHAPSKYYQYGDPGA